MSNSNEAKRMLHRLQARVSVDDRIGALLRLVRTSRSRRARAGDSCLRQVRVLDGEGPGPHE